MKKLEILARKPDINSNLKCVYIYIYIYPEHRLNTLITICNCRHSKLWITKREGTIGKTNKVTEKA
jgi:hypothetical protein